MEETQPQPIQFKWQKYCLNKMLMKKKSGVAIHSLVIPCNKGVHPPPAQMWGADDSII